MYGEQQLYKQKLDVWIATNKIGCRLEAGSRKYAEELSQGAIVLAARMILSPLC